MEITNIKPDNISNAFKEKYTELTKKLRDSDFRVNSDFLWVINSVTHFALLASMDRGQTFRQFDTILGYPFIVDYNSRETDALDIKIFVRMI